MPTPQAARPRTARATALTAALLAGLLAAPGPAGATFNKFRSATALAPGGVELGVAGAFGDTDPDSTSGFLLVRAGVLRNLEVGARLGAITLDQQGEDEAGVLVAVDAKAQILHESIEIPFDFAVDAAWTVALPGGDTYSDLAFAGLFSKTLGPYPVVGTLVPYLGAELVFLSGSARPGEEDTAAFGIAGLEVALGRRLSVTPEVKIGSDAVYGAALRYRF